MMFLSSLDGDEHHYARSLQEGCTGYGNEAGNWNKGTLIGTQEEHRGRVEQCAYGE